MPRLITTTKYDFAQLIENNWLYVDKTEYAWRLISNPARTFFFCSRPRRFGKSLFVSTLECIFEGRKDLFNNLYIGSTDYGFKAYPVIHFDFSDLELTSYEDFRASLQHAIKSQAERNGIEIRISTPGIMFDDLLTATGDDVVVLIDEFDAPITHTLSHTGSEGLAEKILQTFSAFYSKLKSNEGKIRFLFITGITKFANMSIFSQLNNLIDVSMDQGFAAAFGYTQQELEKSFAEEIDRKMALPDCPFASRHDFLSALRTYYDGYRFSNDDAPSFMPIQDELHELESSYGPAFKIPSVYNPVSIGMYFSQDNPSFKNWWDETGVSTLAIELARNVNLLNIVEEPAIAPLSAFKTFDLSSISSASISRNAVLALLYYTGYLTQDGKSTGPLRLRFPNTEIASSFTESLVARYADSADSVQTAIEVGRNALKTGNTAAFIEQLRNYLASFSYELFDGDRERQYQLLFLSFCVASGLKAEGEKHTAKGRIDVYVESIRHVYIIELKLDGSADEAIAQIHDRDYPGFLNTPWSNGKTVHLLGIEFSSRHRNIADWKEELL